MPSGITAAAVVCSRNWTPMCDQIQARVDIATPWLIAAAVLLVCTGAAVAVIGELRRGRRPAEPRAAAELHDRMDNARR